MNRPVLGIGSLILVIKLNYLHYANASPLNSYEPMRAAHANYRQWEGGGKACPSRSCRIRGSDHPVTDLRYFPNPGMLTSFVFSKSGAVDNMALSLSNLEAGHLAAYGFQFNLVVLPGPSWACRINLPLTKRWDVLNHLGDTKTQGASSTK